jgi:hypothetical protein
MTSTIYFRGGRSEAARIVRAMVSTLTGHSRQFSDYARGVYFVIGFAAMSDIHADYIRKARGGTGEDGVKWPPLSPKTLAYSRRFGPGEQTALKAAAGLTRAHHLAPGGKKGLLTNAELKRWRAIFARLVGRFAMDMDLGEAKAKAAAIAWTQLKAAGAKTKLEVFGHREVEILRDTSILLNSLSMGHMASDADAYASGVSNRPAPEDQVFAPIENGIVVGTRVKYARAHNEGVPGRLPARPFIPRPDRIPSQWMARWLDAGMQAVAYALEDSLGQGRAA